MTAAASRRPDHSGAAPARWTDSGRGSPGELLAQEVDDFGGYDGLAVARYIEIAEPMPLAEIADQPLPGLLVLGGLVGQARCLLAG